MQKQFAISARCFHKPASLTYTLLIFPYNNAKLSKRPSGTDVPLPVFSKITAWAAFHIQINMTVFTCGKSGANTIFKPGIIEIIFYFKSIAIFVTKTDFIITAEFMQQIGFDIEISFFVDITP